MPEVDNLRAQRGHLGVLGCVNRLLAIKLEYFDKWNQSICLGGIKGVTKVPKKAIFCGLEPFLGGFRESMRLQWVIIKIS